MKQLHPFEQDYTGKNLVEASAGTGKTYNIVWLYLRFLLKEGFSVSEILVVTYTRAATKELKERLVNRIQDAIKVLKHGYKGSDAMLQALENAEWLEADNAVNKLEEAVRNFDGAAVYTIHGFCKNVLEEMAFESRTSFDAELLTDDRHVIQEIVDDYWRRLVDEAGEDESKALLLQYLIDEKLTPDSLIDCLRPYTGKPYINIIPDDVEWREIEGNFQSLQRIYRELQQIWQEERDEIIALLDPDIMSGYTENNMPGRIETIDELFLNSSASIIDPDNVTGFKYCTQSFISESLLSKARKEGIQPPNHRFFELMDDYGDTCRLLKNTKSIFLKELLQYLQEQLPDKKEELEVLSYDDLLLTMYRSITDPENGGRFAALLRQKYPVALVDEFQDTDPVQYAIFRSVYSGNAEKLFMIGDPKQAIYSFRGADIFAYLEARNDTTADQQFGLRENYRSVPELLTAVNVLFSRTENPFVLPEISYNPVEHGHPEDAYKRLAIDNSPAEAMQIISVESADEADSDKKIWSNEMAMATASDIFQLLRKGDEGRAYIGEESVSARDIAVLVRTHYQADLMNEALATYGLKSVQLSKGSVFHTREAHELEQVLTAIAEPGSERLIRGALITSLIGETANDLYEYEENEEQWVRQVELFSDWNHIWQEHGFSSMFRKLIREEDIALNLMNHRKGERRLTNILHLGELLQHREEEEQAGMRSLIKWMARKRTENKDGREEEELRLESDENLVKIVTMHSSKGLEYPVVFCPFLWTGTKVENSKDPFLFHTGEEKKACLDLTPKDTGERTLRLAEYYKEDLAESMRLAYVAITRAKQQCNIYWHGETGSSEFSPLGYTLLGNERVTAQINKKLKLNNNAEEITEEIFNRALIDLQEEAGSKVNFREWKPPVDTGRRKEQDQRDGLQVRKFSRNDRLVSLQQISSFSSLTTAGSGEVETPDYDQYVIPDTGAVQQPETLNMFGFPRGPQPGTCVHMIFEQLDFSDLSNMDEIITNGLETYGIDSKWNPVLKQNLLSVINKQLVSENQNTILADLEKSDFLHEMEFYFDMEAISNSRIMQIIRESSSHEQGQASPGFMKGYIDLTVQFGDRFYIIDYKTNYLGSQPGDYTFEIMREEIYEAAYDLQYHIYTVALHRYLKERLTGYRYEDHFGGVLYLFLRGINDKTSDYRGIYFDRPGKSKINKLDQYLKAGGVA